MDCNLLGSSVHGILQESILEWGAMPSSRGSSQPRNPTHISLAGGFFTTSTTWEAPLHEHILMFYFLPVFVLKWIVLREKNSDVFKFLKFAKNVLLSSIFLIIALCVLAKDSSLLFGMWWESIGLSLITIPSISLVQLLHFLWVFFPHPFILLGLT